MNERPGSEAGHHNTLVVAGLAVAGKRLLGGDRRSRGDHDPDGTVGQGEMGGCTRL
jgi:hypothetical protein